MWGRIGKFMDWSYQIFKFCRLPLRNSPLESVHINPRAPSIPQKHHGSTFLKGCPRLSATPFGVHPTVYKRRPVSFSFILRIRQQSGEYLGCETVDILFPASSRRRRERARCRDTATKFFVAHLLSTDPPDRSTDWEKILSERCPWPRSRPFYCDDCCFVSRS